MSAALIRWGSILAALLLATGCGSAAVVSLHPLSPEQDLVSAPDLTGTWRQMGAEGPTEGTWAFERSSGPTYRLTVQYPDDPSPLTFETGLVRLGGYLFLNMKPDDPIIMRYSPQLVPFYILLRIWVDREAFLVRSMDADWFARGARSGQIQIPYVLLGEDFFLITAPPPELRRFALQYATDGEAFPRASGITFVRAESP